MARQLLTMEQILSVWTLVGSSALIRWARFPQTGISPNVLPNGDRIRISPSALVAGECTCELAILPR